MYLLDTNHCSRLLDSDPQVTKRMRELGDELCAICAIVQGELVFMAERSEYAPVNRRKVEAFLRDIDVYEIDGRTANVYGRLKSAILDHFGPRQKNKRKKFKIEKIGFTDNDLWIAAVAKRHGLTLVSADGDFKRIKEVVEDFYVEQWWFPDASGQSGVKSLPPG